MASEEEIISFRSINNTHHRGTTRRAASRSPSRPTSTGTHDNIWPNSPSRHSTKKKHNTISSGEFSTISHHPESQQLLLALNVASVASFILVTVFGLFHVDVFLRAYKLPLQTFSTGNLIFSVVNTSNDFFGAWFLDSIASKRSRSDLIGISGVLFSLFFLAPFSRWKDPTTPFKDGAHFVLSVSLYDTILSFHTILLGSLVIDNHHMSDKERVWFMASGKICNLITAFFVVRIGLELFDEEDLKHFRIFLKVLALVAALMFVFAQLLARYSFVVRFRPISFRYHRKRRTLNIRKKTQKVRLGQVFFDLRRHRNFWAWIGMELLLESQVSFVNAFLKTFVDRLVYDAGRSRDYCDWLLSALPPAGLIFGVLIYIPIRTMSYQKVYPILFVMNTALCLFMMFAASHESTSLIIFFLSFYPTITSAVQSAGFHLVMSDMVLEMKKMHASEGRFDEPSLAGLFMGVNNLFSKPAEYLLPVIAASSLEIFEKSLEESEHGSDHVRQVLYRLLVVPPLIFSVLQYFSWRSYTLTPAKTRQLRDELTRSELPLTEL